MFLAVAGLLLAALGLFAGGVLVAGPMGLAPAGAGWTLWALFPLFTIAGLGIFVIGARTSQLRMPSLLTSWLLLGLALLAAGGLLLDAAGIRPAQGSTLALWFVGGVAGLLGGVGAAALGRPDDRD